MISRFALVVLAFSLMYPSWLGAGVERPRLLVSPEDVELMTNSNPVPTLFSGALDSARQLVDTHLGDLPDIPLPADAGGGYTHEQHKRNANIIQNAGLLYLVTGEQAYSRLVADMLGAYARMYPSLGEHPKKKEQTPGRLFWQSLNEAVWLLTAIQGYDAVYEALDNETRARIETGLFRPLAEFLSVGQPKTFDKVHNHGTWAVAAVGMTGYVLDEPAYVEKALLGLNRDGEAGFLKQMDRLFSPDGYYSEGPYYQRYALMPFLLFARSIDRNEPERRIFEYRDGILLKAITTTIHLSYAGLFFPINDAIKDKGIDTIELVYGVSIAYALTGDSGLLSIAEEQGRVVLTGDGFRVAQSLDAGLAEPFAFDSRLLRDGPEGRQGGLGIMRSGPEPGHVALVFKATAQGMGHGHFDKLAWIFYDNGQEVVTDYGAARFLNVEQKYGGHYLPENKSWAKQTVAHNTLVADETSHFAGKLSQAEQHHPRVLRFETDERIDLATAIVDGTYAGLSFSRTLALLKQTPFAHPPVLDILRVESDRDRQLDLPLHYRGQVTHVSHPVEAATESMAPLGSNNGYQHLWSRAVSQVEKGELFQLTWLLNNRFYTWSVLAEAPMEVHFVETGANDPDFNLRKESAVILRVQADGDHAFVSLLEPHGEYNGPREYTTASTTSLASLERKVSEGREVVRLTTTGDESFGITFSQPPGEEK